jgi:hypothetical protein
MSIVRIVAGVAALALSAQMLTAQQPGQPGGMMRGPGMAQQMRMMDSLNARLDTLVSRMNRASGNKKVAAMADVINELVAHRKMMQEHMRQMMESRQGMMMHMMGQPAPGESRAPASTADSAAVDSAAHAAHHPPN